MVMGGKLLICAGNTSTNGIKFGSFAISFAEVSIKASMTLIVLSQSATQGVFAALVLQARSSKGGASSALKSLFFEPSLSKFSKRFHRNTSSLNINSLKLSLNSGRGSVNKRLAMYGYAFANTLNFGSVLNANPSKTVKLRKINA